MHHLELLEGKVRDYVTGLFQDFFTPALAYHDLEHTLMVVMRVAAIGAFYELSEDEKFTLFAAAWFHDTGQLFGPPAGHEERSVKIMEAFFSNHETVLAQTIAAITECILATKSSSAPAESVGANYL